MTIQVTSRKITLTVLFLGLLGCSQEVGCTDLFGPRPKPEARDLAAVSTAGNVGAVGHALLFAGVLGGITTILVGVGKLATAFTDSLHTVSFDEEGNPLPNGQTRLAKGAEVARVKSRKYSRAVGCIVAGLTAITLAALVGPACIFGGGNRLYKGVRPNAFTSNDLGSESST